MKNAKMRKGFTLIELLVAMALIGMLAAIAVNTFFPSLTKTYVSMMKHDLDQMGHKNLDYYTQYGVYLYNNNKLQPKESGFVEVNMGKLGGIIKVPMTRPEPWRSGMYEVRFGRGVCANSGKPGMNIETWVNRGGLYQPVLYGKYDSCTMAHPRVWEQVLVDGKAEWVER